MDWDGNPGCRNSFEHCQIWTLRHPNLAPNSSGRFVSISACKHISTLCAHSQHVDGSWVGLSIKSSVLTYSHSRQVLQRAFKIRWMWTALAKVSRRARKEWKGKKVKGDGKAVQNKAKVKSRVRICFQAGPYVGTAECWSNPKKRIGWGRTQNKSKKLQWCSHSRNRLMRARTWTRR